jgi:hypothetical protein
MNFATAICLVLAALVGAVTVRRFLGSRRYLRYLNAYPNEAYDFFISDPERWVVYEAAGPELVSDRLPSAAGLPQGKLLGPFLLRVPKRSDRAITVYGKSRDCLEALDQFVFRMKVEAHSARL